MNNNKKDAVAYATASFLYKQHDKPGYVWRRTAMMIIYLVLMLPPGSSDLPESATGRRIAFLFGLASDGVYICHCCYQQCGELLPRLSTLTLKSAVYFCCTSLGVASTGRYPASCPMKLGLSSPKAFRH